MSDSALLRKRQEEWLAWVESELQRPGRDPAEVEALRQQARLIAEARLKRQLDSLAQLEARGVPGVVAEELVMLRGRIDALEELLKHPDTLVEMMQKLKRSGPGSAD